MNEQESKQPSPECQKIEEAILKWESVNIEKGHDPVYVVRFFYKDPKIPWERIDELTTTRGSLIDLIENLVHLMGSLKIQIKMKEDETK